MAAADPLYAADEGREAHHGIFNITIVNITMVFIGTSAIIIVVIIRDNTDSIIIWLFSLSQVRCYIFSRRITFVWIEKPMDLCPRLRVALVNYANGERYALPGVGEADNWTIPASCFTVQEIIGKELHALEKSDAEGTFRLARTPHPANEIIRTAAPVCAFVSKDGRVRMCGPIAPLADENGNAFVIFRFHTTS